MEATVKVEFSLPILRATIKSLSIGCDQLSKKVEGARSPNERWFVDTAAELGLLLEARARLEQALSNLMKEFQDLA